MTIATVIQRFWLPIIMVVAMVIYAIRAARRLDSLSARDDKVIDRKPPASGFARPPQSIAARIIFAMCAFAPIVLLLYSRRVALVHATTMDYLLVAIVSGALVFAFVRLRQGLGVSAGRRYQAVTWFILAAICVRGVLLLANAVLDPRPAREFTTVVATRHCGQRGSEITVRGAPTLPVVAAGIMGVNVSHSTCRAARAGDTVVVLIGPGYFGRAWVQGSRPIQAARQ